MRAAAIATVVMLLGIAAIFASCYPRPPDPVRPDASDAAAPPTCEEACVHVELGLGCATDGACGSLCRHVLRPGYRACIAAAPDCDAVSRCGR